MLPFALLAPVFDHEFVELVHVLLRVNNFSFKASRGEVMESAEH